jgi:hypothetical protein
MESQLLQENIELKAKLQDAEKYIKELEIIKQKYLAKVKYECDIMFGGMKDGPLKDELINMFS